MTREYFKIVCSKEHKLTGAGLGYDHIFGPGPRYFWRREDANAHAENLNHWPDDPGDLNGTYTVERRTLGDDADDDYCKKQLGE